MISSFVLLFLNIHFEMHLCTNEPVVIDSLTFQIQKDSNDMSDKHSESDATPLSTEEPKLVQNISTLTKSTIKHSSDKPCPGIVCFVKKFETNSIFDCQRSIGKESETVVEPIYCTYWQKPQTLQSAKFPRLIRKRFIDSEDETDALEIAEPAEPIRIRLRPQSSNGQHRVYAKEAESGALLRLGKSIRSELKLADSIPLKISLMMLRIDRLNSTDLSLLFVETNVNNLVLWNPVELEETSFLLPRDTHVKNNNFVRITLHCEPENVKPAFTRLWIPWMRWIIHFRHCDGKFSCYPWPPSSPLCCQKDRCPEVPNYVIIPNEVEINEDNLISSNFQSEHLVSYSSCETEPKLSDPLSDLKYLNSCWALPKKVLHEVDGTTMENYDNVNSPEWKQTAPTTTEEMTTDFKTTKIREVLSTENNTTRYEITDKTSTKFVFNTTPILTSNESTYKLFKSEESVLRNSKYKEELHLRKLTACVISLLVVNMLIFIGMFLLFCWMSRKWKKRDRDESYWLFRENSEFRSNLDSNSGSSCISKLEDCPTNGLGNSAIYVNGSGYRIVVPRGSPRTASHRSIFVGEKIPSSKSSPYNMRKPSPMQGRRQGKQHTLVMESTVDPQLLEPNLHPL